jgi:hypothetical protein
MFFGLFVSFSIIRENLQCSSHNFLIFGDEKKIGDELATYFLEKNYFIGFYWKIKNPQIIDLRVITLI